MESHLEDITGGRQNLRVFIPLCGRAVELKWYFISVDFVNLSCCSVQKINDDDDDDVVRCACLLSLLVVCNDVFGAKRQFIC